MRVIVTDSYEEMSMAAAKVVAGQIYLKPDSVLGLATGSTPLTIHGCRPISVKIQPAELANSGASGAVIIRPTPPLLRSAK